MQVGARRRAALAAAALLVAGCGTDSSAGRPTSSVAVTVAPPGTSATNVDPALQGQLEAANIRYWGVYDSVYNDPRQNLAVIDTVAAGEEAASLRDQAAQVLEQGLIGTGSIKVVRLTVTSVTPAPVEGGPTTVMVKSCNDVSGTTATTPDGKSVIDPNRLPQTKAILTFQDTTPNDPAGWRVIKGLAGPTIPCDG